MTDYIPQPGDRYEHADGGEYKVVRLCKVKDPTTGYWLNGIAYEDAAELFVTTLERWAERFTLIPRPSLKEALAEMAESGVWDDFHGEMERERKASSIANEFVGEYEYAVNKWGTKSDDEKNRPNDFVAYIAHHSTRWFNGGFAPYNRTTLEAFRREMVKVGGLAVSAITTTDKILCGEITRPDVMPPEQADQPDED